MRYSNNILEGYKDVLHNLKNIVVKHYPIILINGIILPQEYVVSDLQYLGLDFFNKDFKI